MSFQIRHTRVVLPTTSGSQNITISGIGTPIGAIFCYNRATSNIAEAVNNGLMIGCTDGVNQRAVLMDCEDSVDPTNAWTQCLNDSVALTIDPTNGNLVGRASFSGWITDGLRINWTSAPSAASFMNVIFFIGSGIDIGVGDFNSESDESVNLGFRPDQIFIFGVDDFNNASFTDSTVGGSNAGASYSIGIVDRND